MALSDLCSVELSSFVRSLLEKIEIAGFVNQLVPVSSNVTVGSCLAHIDQVSG